MQELVLGQKRYLWQVQRRYPLNYQEVYVRALADPEQTLIADVFDDSVMTATFHEITAPKSVKALVDYALKKKWGEGQKLCMRMAVNGVFPVTHSLEEERQLVLSLRKKVELSREEYIDMPHRLQLFLQEELALGFEIPALFKYLYLYLGNGGFGPDYGFLPLEPRSASDYGLLSAYEKMQALPTGLLWALPKHFLPFLHWGCDIFSLLDCSRYPYKVYTFDPNLWKEGERDWEYCIWEHAPSFLAWLERWAAGDVYGKALWLDMYRSKGLIKS